MCSFVCVVQYLSPASLTDIRTVGLLLCTKLSAPAGARDLHVGEVSEHAARGHHKHHGLCRIGWKRDLRHGARDDDRRAVHLCSGWCVFVHVCVCSFIVWCDGEVCVFVYMCALIVRMCVWCAVME